MANRKLQGEIDRTLKKVAEGLIEFDGIFQKISSSPSQNQKEKHENDLKREIKKLQRLREQIKAWIGQNDVKNKEPLVEARQKIEKEMERYKAYERESKTKEFSNEGLRLKMKNARSANTKRQQFIEFLDETLTTLKEQSTKLEKSIKNLEAKETDDPDELEQDALKIAELDETIDRHKAHIENGEKLLIKFKAKKLSNESVAPVHETLEKYLSGEDDSVGEHHDQLVALYDQLDLDNLSGENAADAEDGEGEEGGDDDEGAGDDDLDDLDDDEEEEVEVPAPKPKEVPKSAQVVAVKAQSPAPAPVTAASPAVALTSSQTIAKPAAPVVAATPIPVATPVQVPVAAKEIAKAPAATPATESKSNPLPPSQRAAARQAETVAQTPAQPLAKIKKTKGTPLPLGPQPGDDSDYPRLGQVVTPATPPPAVVPEESTSSLAAASGLFQSAQPQPPQPTKTVAPPPTPVAAVVKPPAAATTAPTPASTVSALSSSSSNVPPPVAAASTPTPAQRAALAAQAQLQQAQQPVAVVVSSPATQPAPSPAPAQPSPLVPSGPPATVEQMLMRSWRCLPDSTAGLGLPLPVSSSGESMLPLVEYTPRSPVQVHPSFPSSMAPNFDDASMFEKFDTDTLFFIFYYQQGTYQQYLAAKELKRQAWRYHKKYLTWFQRHEEPKEITPEYEQGTYVYFDYETGWCQRKKTEFTFEYRYLEDKDLL